MSLCKWVHCKYSVTFYRNSSILMDPLTTRMVIHIIFSLYNLYHFGCTFLWLRCSDTYVCGSRYVLIKYLPEKIRRQIIKANVTPRERTICYAAMVSFCTRSVKYAKTQYFVKCSSLANYKSGVILCILLILCKRWFLFAFIFYCWATNNRIRILFCVF